jgi:hypothetical protein
MKHSSLFVEANNGSNKNWRGKVSQLRYSSAILLQTNYLYPAALSILARRLSGTAKLTA